MIRTHQAGCSSCGWQGTLTSPARAAWAQQQHRCAGHRAAAAERARGDQRRAAVDRTPKPCLHKVANHQHGTYAAYTLDRCRCLPCTEANTAYYRRLNRQKVYGRYDGLIDADPARAHVRELMAAGVGLKQISKLANVSGGVLNKLMYGSPRPDASRRPPAARIRPSTAERLLAVPISPDSLAGGVLIDATGTIRRLRALVALGWSQQKLAIALGQSPANFGKTIRGRQVTAATARTVTELYERMWNEQPPATNQRERISVSRARRHAAEQGWLPPLAWDDETIDDPSYDPNIVTLDQGDDLDEVAVLRIMSGTLNVGSHARSAERTEAIRRLAAAGLNDREIGDRVHMTYAAVCKERIRRSIPAGVPTSRTA